MKEKIEKARKIAIEKWGEKNYQEEKYYFDNAEKDGDYMYAVEALLKDNNIDYMTFHMLATSD